MFTGVAHTMITGSFPLFLQTLYLDWKPLCRDVFVYGISIILLIGFSWDGYLEWYEVTILLFMYISYILLMKANVFIMSLLEQLTCRYVATVSGGCEWRV